MKLPVMRCDDGCGDCCGVVPITEKELKRLKDYVRVHHIQPVDQGPTCPLYLNGRCSVHEVRPAICRAFGHTAGMSCPRGYNVNVPERKIRRYLMRGGPSPRLTHDVLPNGREVAIKALEEFK